MCTHASSGRGDGEDSAEQHVTEEGCQVALGLVGCVWDDHGVVSSTHGGPTKKIRGRQAELLPRHCLETEQKQKKLPPKTFAFWDFDIFIFIFENPDQTLFPCLVANVCSVLG